MIQFAAETSGSIGMGSGLAVVIIALLLVFAGGTGGRK